MFLDITVMPGKLRLKTALLVVGVVVATCGITFSIRNVLRDRPIPGGIVAYRAHNLEGRRHTHCACGHKGYFILTEQLVLWYVTDHETFQPHGEIISSDGDRLTVKPIQQPINDQELSETLTMEKRDNKLRIVEPASEFAPVSDYTLKKIFLGSEIREQVENFDYEEWRRSQRD